MHLHSGKALIKFSAAADLALNTKKETCSQERETDGRHEIRGKKTIKEESLALKTMEKPKNKNLFVHSDEEIFH